MAGVILGILSSCAGSRHYHALPAEAAPSIARYLELNRPVHVATLHFPAGVYSLQAADDAGYYYAAPRSIVQHTAAGLVFRNGGVYVSKRDPRKLRAYVYWGGALTHLGNFSRARHEFREEPERTARFNHE
ncbi:MAG: hypothetical protein ACREIW_07430 [Chthoniobacterales bacterium]